MDWLRPEDLKEEKVVTTSVLSVAASEGLLRFNTNQEIAKPRVDSAAREQQKATFSRNEGLVVENDVKK
jgi:hypothetical protein